MCAAPEAEVAFYSFQGRTLMPIGHITKNGPLGWKWAALAALPSLAAESQAPGNVNTAGD